MNIQRYKWPVIVAASLHGALLLSTPNHPLVIRTPAVKTTPISDPPPVEPIAMREPEDPPSGGDGGPVSQLPALPDTPVLAELRDVITIPPVDRSVSNQPITDLKNIPTTGIGGEAGEGPMRMGPPRIPRLVDLDRVPRAMAQSSPEYPYSLRQAGITGSVTVEFVVGTDGAVMSAEAVRWTHREFVDPAVRAVLRWKFEPGTIDSRKVCFRMAVPIEFNAT
jgi:protein TonB